MLRPGTSNGTGMMAKSGADLASGAWDRRYGALRSQPSFDGPLRLIIAR